MALVSVKRIERISPVLFQRFAVVLLEHIALPHFDIHIEGRIVAYSRDDLSSSFRFLPSTSLQLFSSHSIRLIFVVSLVVGGCIASVTTKFFGT